MSIRVFITRNLFDDDNLVHRLIKRGIEVRAQALIEIVPVDFDPNIPLTDWIFFSSKNAVQFFFNQNIRLSTQKLAAVGEGTAALLKKYGPVDFIGKDIDTNLTAIEFKKIVELGTVLFPQAKNGWRTIQKVFDPSKISELICYETLQKSIPVGFPDVLVFSSPSNVEAYFELNKIVAHQKIIAFGHSTGQSLQKHGILEYKIPISLSDNDLFEAIIEAVES